MWRRRKTRSCSDFRPKTVVRTCSLAKAKDQAEQTSASKSRYLAAASHDLRQPMQALAMFVEVLAGRQHDQGSREIIDKIQASSKALESLLNSLLDISKLEADLVVPDVRRFRAGELTSRLAEEIEPRAQGRGFDFLVRTRRFSPPARRWSGRWNNVWLTARNG